MDRAISDTFKTSSCFVTMFRTAVGERSARIALESLRSFGGGWRDNPVYVNLIQPCQVTHPLEGIEGLHFIELIIENDIRNFPLVEKVAALSQTETAVSGAYHSMIWIDPSCLVVNPPRLFELDDPIQAAFRPVHIKNVGSVAAQPVDDYWKAIYDLTGVGEIPYTVESFIDRSVLRPYFNTHCFSLNPSLGICQKWSCYFRAMATDRTFQSFACQDELHKIFLHQAILSAQVMQSLTRQQVRVLPPEYNYPLHLHQSVPISRQAEDLNSLVNPVYEDDFQFPQVFNGLPVREPLYSWLRKY